MNTKEAVGTIMMVYEDKMKELLKMNHDLQERNTELVLANRELNKDKEILEQHIKLKIEVKEITDARQKNNSLLP